MSGMDHVDVAVIGGGPAGLAASRELTRARLEHLVLERARVGESWRGRWDSFRLVTPNWSTQLPGRGYDGSDPDGFMARDEVVAYLERYAGDLGARIREGVEVGSLESRRGGGFVLRTSSGDLRADTVVVATGTYRSAVPAGRCADAAGRSASTGCRRLPQRAGSAAGPRARGGKRPVRVPDRGGAPRCGPGSVPGLREGSLGATSPRRPRLRLVGGRNGLPRHVRRVLAHTGSPARRERAGDRTWREAAISTSGRFASEGSL